MLEGLQADMALLEVLQPLAIGFDFLGSAQEELLLAGIQCHELYTLTARSTGQANIFSFSCTVLQILLAWSKSSSCTVQSFELMALPLNACHQC
jgi:hypothetical protein